jgi:spore photoproduct lyase
MTFVPDQIWVERGEEASPVAATALARFAAAAVRFFDPDRPPPAVDFAGGKRSLVLKRHRGGFLAHCPAGTSGQVCCNYLVVNFASNCPFDCSYCFLQDYLADNARLTAFTNVESGLAEIERVLTAHPGRQFRIGTGELADSLALDPATGLSRLLVPFFAERDNAVLELKTKSACIDELLALDPRGRTVVSWSLSPPPVSAEEYGTAAVADRLAAAARVLAAGYRVGFHLDPIVEHEGWEASYGRLLDETFAAVSPDAIAWFSLGSLRMTPALRRRIRARPAGAPAYRALGAELVPNADGKLRVWRGLRVRMYRFLAERIRERAPGTTLYLCMEGAGVWQQAMREVPSDRELGARLTAGAVV